MREVALQDIIYATEDYRELDAYLAENGIQIGRAHV